MRAFLIVPGDARAVAAAMASDAHALIVDVTGLASPAFFPERRQGAPLFYLRSCELERDLSAMMAVAPDGIVLSRCEGARDVTRLGARLAVEEAIHGLADGSTQILAFIDTARGALALHTLADAGERLVGIAWDAAAMKAEIAAPTTRDGGGALRPPLAQVRALVRLAAAAARVTAIDTPCLPGGDFAGEVAAAWEDGFEAKLVFEPDQAGFVKAFSFLSPASSADS
ncbi:aldolase/citrate lyase family protein [Methylobacterium sp. CM6244]